MGKRTVFLEYTITGKVRVPAGNTEGIEGALKPIRKVFEAAGSKAEVVSVRTRSEKAVKAQQEQQQEAAE